MNGSRRGATTINGVEFPPEFDGGSIVNNLAISRDGSKYGFVTPDRDLFVGEVPDNGRVEVDGQTIQIHSSGGTRGITVVGSSRGNTIVSSLSGMNILKRTCHSRDRDDLL